jgi:hypothetical protein
MLVVRYPEGLWLARFCLAKALFKEAIQIGPEAIPRSHRALNSRRRRHAGKKRGSSAGTRRQF